MLDEPLFQRMLGIERKRTERSLRRFVLMLLDLRRLTNDGPDETVIDRVVPALSGSTRDTDVRGWYKAGSVIGVIYTEVGSAEAGAVTDSLHARVIAALSGTLSDAEVEQLRFSFHVFPESPASKGGGGLIDPPLYSDLKDQGPSKTVARIIKRTMDIIGSLMALVLATPILIAVSVLIKLTSKGPVLFRQERVGQGGRRFTFLKFRSMHVANDHTIHKEYVRQFIAGTNGTANGNGKRDTVYKLTNDPRITGIGRFLRRTSLDELPQFINVLRGDMSLVGPRPPIPYEFETYQIWHRSRLTAVKPGITGLWQVRGRSRTRFDEMVRLDLQYARSWSLWLDVKILFETPRAVFSGSGAY